MVYTVSHHYFQRLFTIFGLKNAHTVNGTHIQHVYKPREREVRTNRFR